MQIFAPISPLFNIGLSCAFFSLNLHLVGLCRMRLCLKLQQGTLSLDPCKPSDAGLVPAFYLSLRSVLTFTLCLCTTLVSFANSSLLTPHFSFLIPHSSFLTSHSSFLISTSFLHNTNTPITFGTAISPLKISDTPHTSSMLHIVPMHPQAIAMIL